MLGFKTPALAVLLLSCSVATASADIQSAKSQPREAYQRPPLSATFASGVVAHGMVRCVRNPQCRDAIARRAQRVVQIVSELALGGAEAISDLVSEMLEDPHKDDVLKRLDRLERMLKDKGLYTAEIERELDLIRTAYE